MAFSQGKESTTSGSGVSFKHYVGVGAVKILAVNPTKDEWNNIMGSNMEKEIEYTGVTEDGVKTARVTLLVQPDASRTVGNIDAIIPITFWFRLAPIKGQTSGKYRVIDKYARTAWVTEEELKTHAIPQYSNGPADIDKDYRPLVRGEEEFTNFMRAHLMISSPRIFNDTTKAWETNPHMDECEGRLDDIKKIFNGDFSEIKKILGYQKDNYSKVLFGVRTVDGKERQVFYPGLFLTNKNRKHVNFAKRLKEDTDRGQYADTYFGELNPNGELIVADLHEYEVKPSEFTETATPAPGVASPSDNDLPF